MANLDTNGGRRESATFIPCYCNRQGRRVFSSAVCPDTLHLMHHWADMIVWTCLSLCLSWSTDTTAALCIEVCLDWLWIVCGDRGTDGRRLWWLISMLCASGGYPSSSVTVEKEEAPGGWTTWVCVWCVSRKCKVQRLIKMTRGEQTHMGEK